MAKLRFHGDLYEDTNRVVNVSNASSSNPAAPGTASPGVSSSYARADHVHPPQMTINGHAVNADVPAGADFGNTTYSFAEGSVNGKFSVTPSGGSAQSVAVHGLKALAYKDSLTASEVGALSSSTVIPSKTSDLTNDSGFITTESDPTVPAWAKASSKPTYTATEVGALPSSTVIPSKTSDLTNDSGFITTETDPTVPSWAKASTKPSYTASEVGALPSTTIIPSKTSDLTNDSGFITTETDPTVPAWAKASSKPTYTASEVGALPANTSIPSKTSDLTNDSGFITEADAFVVTITMSSGTYTSNKTYDQILAAINSGLSVYAIYNSNVYQLQSYASSKIVFGYHYSVRQLWTITIRKQSGNTTVSYDSYTITIPELPTPLHIHAYIQLTYGDQYETGVDKWYVSQSDFYDMYYAFDNGMQSSENMDMGTIILHVGDTWAYEAEGVPYNSDHNLYYLTKQYTTWDSTDERFIGYLQFSRTVTENGITKIKTFDISGGFGLTIDDWTITYTEKTVREAARIFTGTSTSVVTSPQEGDICLVYTS